MRSENLTINAAAGGAAASSRLDIRAAAGITGAYVAYMMGSGFSTGQEILQYFACYGMAGLFSILLCMGLLIFAAVSSSGPDTGSSSISLRTYTYTTAAKGWAKRITTLPRYPYTSAS